MEKNADQKKPTVKLLGVNGNAYVVIGVCRAAAKKAGWTSQQIADLTDEMTSGDYSNVLATACKHFTVK